MLLPTAVIWSKSSSDTWYFANLDGSECVSSFKCQTTYSPFYAFIHASAKIHIPSLENISLVVYAIDFPLTIAHKFCLQMIYFMNLAITWQMTNARITVLVNRYIMWFFNTYGWPRSAKHAHRFFLHSTTFEGAALNIHPPPSPQIRKKINRRQCNGIYMTIY